MKIRSTGCYIPSVKVDSSKLDRKFRVAPGSVERATGIRTRYHANRVETSPYMGARAVLDALHRGGLSMKDVDAVISVSGTAAQLLPCTASLILEELGELDSGIAAFDINATCLGFIVGFDTVSHLIAGGRNDRVVLVATEASAGAGLLSPTELESAALFGDGAVAIVVERARKGDASRVGGWTFATYPRGAHTCELRALGTTLPPTGKRKPTEKDYYFRMDGPAVFRLTYALMPPFLDRFLGATGQSISDFDLIVPHQASGPALRVMIRRFDSLSSEDKVFVYLREYGNLVAASIPLGIHLAIEQGRLERGAKVLLVGTGAGLSLGALSFVY